MDSAYKNQYDKLLERIPYDEDIFGNATNYKIVINDLLDNAKFKALSLAYPFEDYAEMDLPKKYYNWQIRACIEMYNMADKSVFLTYSENGLTFTKLTDGLSRSLISEIVSKVGVPKRPVIEDVTEEEEEEENV